jgi:hypothetical protein
MSWNCHRRVPGPRGALVCARAFVAAVRDLYACIPSPSDNDAMPWSGYVVRAAIFDTDIGHRRGAGRADRWCASLNVLSKSWSKPAMRTIRAGKHPR